MTRLTTTAIRAMADYNLETIVYAFEHNKVSRCKELCVLYSLAKAELGRRRLEAERLRWSMLDPDCWPRFVPAHDGKGSFCPDILH